MIGAWKGSDEARVTVPPERRSGQLQSTYEGEGDRREVGLTTAVEMPKKFPGAGVDPPAGPPRPH